MEIEDSNPPASKPPSEGLSVQHLNISGNLAHYKVMGKQFEETMTTLEKNLGAAMNSFDQMGKQFKMVMNGFEDAKSKLDSMIAGFVSGE